MKEETKEAYKELLEYRNHIKKEIEKQQEIEDDPNNHKILREIAHKTRKGLEKRLFDSRPSLKKLK